MFIALKIHTYTHIYIYNLYPYSLVFNPRPGNESPLEFDDPFLCFELLLEHQRISNSFLAAMCSWTRNHLHSKAESPG